MLVVLCHGIGADGRDMIGLEQHWVAVLPRAAFVAPHAPFPYDQGPAFRQEAPHRDGRQWFSVQDRRLEAIEAGMRAARALLDGFIDAELARLSLPPDAYALVGFSQGAMVALFTGLRREVGPQGVVSFSGALVAPGTLAEERRNAAPVMLVHGRDDVVVPATLTRHAEAVLHADGVPVTMRLLPALGHAIDEAGLALGGAFLRDGFATKAPALPRAAE